MKINLPEELPKAEPDVCIIWRNLLENVLKACENVEKNEWGRVFMEAECQRLVIIVDNTVPTPPKKKRDWEFLSSCHKDLGIGI